MSPQTYKQSQGRYDSLMLPLMLGLMLGEAPVLPSDCQHNGHAKLIHTAAACCHNVDGQVLMAGLHLQ